jgi:tRNA-splicing endonuclease subunit Sen54
MTTIYAEVSGGSWELFEGYRHPKSLGYIVGQHGISWSMKGAKSNSQSVSLQGSSQSSEVVDAESEGEGKLVLEFQ